MKQKSDAKDFWARSEDGYWWRIAEGTGDNLTQEDIDNGYVDYIYYDYYESLDDVKEDYIYDGGMILLEKLYKDHSLDEIVKIVEDFEDVKLKVVE